MADDRLETIRALLAQAESTTFPEEAAAFNAKAAELMARYAVDEAMLARAQQRAEQPAEVAIVVHRPYIGQKAVLVCEVARNFGCRSIRLGSSPGDPHERVSVVGFPADLALVETLVTSLFLQLGSTMLTSQPVTGSAAASASWRRSYIGGFITEISERLAAARSAATVEVSAAGTRPANTAAGAANDGGTAGESPASVAVVLAGREAEVESDFRRRYPRVRSARVSIGSSAAGHRSGRAAGARADLGGVRLGVRPAIGR